MKKVILSIAALLFVTLSFAQDYSAEELEIFQETFGAEKRIIVEENIDLSGVNAEKFWNLYDEYEKSRQEMGSAKVALLKKYTSSPGNMTEQQAADLLAEAVPLRTAEDKLILNYTKRIGKSCSNIVSVQFYQIEHFISDGMRYAILNNIDFIQDKK